MAPGAFFPSRASRRKRKSDDLKWSVTTEDGRKRSSSVFTAARWRHDGARGGGVRERGSSHKKEEDPVKPADLLYLHDGSGPRSGAVVVVDIICSSLSVLPLLPSRG